MPLRGRTMDKAHSAGTALMAKKAPWSTQFLSFRTQVKPCWQRAALRSVSSHRAGRIFCFSSSREESLERSRVERDPTTQCHLVTLREIGGPPCLLLLTKHEKPAPRQAQPHRSSNPGTSLAHRIQKNTFFKYPKYHKTSQRKRVHSATAHLKSLQVSPAHPTCYLPVPAPHKHDLIPAGLSTPAHTPSTFHTAKHIFTRETQIHALLPSMILLRSVVLSLTRAPRLRQKSTHLF